MNQISELFLSISDAAYSFGWLAPWFLQENNFYKVEISTFSIVVENADFKNQTLHVPGFESSDRDHVGPTYVTLSPVLSLVCPGEAFSETRWLPVIDGLDDFAGHRGTCSVMCRQSVRFGVSWAWVWGLILSTLIQQIFMWGLLCAKSCTVRPWVDHLTSLSPSFLFC